MRRAIRDEAVRLLEERRDLEERARLAHRSGFAPPTVLEEYAGWSERCEALAERWRAMGGDTPAPQLRRDPPSDKMEEIAADIVRLEELRGHDEAWARWFAMRRSIVEEMSARNTIPFYIEGWSAFVDRARALAERAGLPEAAAEAAERTLKYDSARRKERSAVEGFLHGAGEHRRWWNTLREEAARRARRDPAFSIVDLPGYRPLSDRERAALRTGRRILRKEDIYGPHLDRIPKSREALDAGLERLNGHRLLDRFVAVMNRIGETRQGAFARGIAPVDDAGYGGAIARAERLANEDGLEEAARRRLRAELEAHAALAADWLEFERLFREAGELDERYRELEQRAVREDVPRSLLSEWTAWRDRNLRFEKDARWVFGDERIDECRMAYAQPIAALELPIPVESGYERQALLSLPRLVRDLRSDGALREALGGAVEVELQKPLFPVRVREGLCLPDVLLTVTRPGGSGHGPGDPDSGSPDGPFDDSARARYVIEVMGFDDAEYERKKEETHRRMERLGRVIRLEGKRFGSDSNGLERQRDRITGRIAKELIRRWTGR